MFYKVLQYVLAESENGLTPDLGMICYQERVFSLFDKVTKTDNIIPEILRIPCSCREIDSRSCKEFGFMSFYLG